MKSQREINLVNKGREYFNNGEHLKAKKIFAEVVELNDGNAEAFFYLANIFHLSGEIGKAIKAFNKVLSIDSSHTDAAISLSVLYNDIGRYEEAKKIFDAADDRVKGKTRNSDIDDKHINKKFSFQHYTLADLYMTYNRYDEALFEYNKAIGLDPENLEARVKIAKVYAKKGFTSKAFDELRKLKNEQPSYLPARVALGVLYYGTGNVLDAQAEWGKVLSKDPHHEEASMYFNLSKTATETSI